VRRPPRFLYDVFRRVYSSIGLYLVVITVGAIGFFFLEQNSPELGTNQLLNSFYWSVVTLTTVGYGDITPTTSTARLFTIVLLSSQLFLLGYLVATASAAVNEASTRRALGVYGTTFSRHVVVLGYSGVGRAAVRELLLERQRVALVTENPQDIPHIRDLAGEDRLFITSGPPADDQVLARVNIQEAHGVIACAGDDTVNLIAALKVRALAPKVRIVVSVDRAELRTTLRSAGVTYVASPADMGGRLCSDAAFRPEVANAVEDLTSPSYGADIQEYVLSSTTPISTQTLAEAEKIVRGKTGCLIIGCARAGPDGEYVTQINPPDDYRFQPGDALVVLGTNENLRKFRDFFGVDQGR
jgi:voltage-gated potassium channel